MTKISKALAKGSVATMAAGALALGAAAPTQAQARDRWGRDDGISAGEVIAGAVVLGGLAAILSSAGRDRYDDYRYRDRDYRYRNGDYRYRDRDYRDGYRYDNGRYAVEQCVREAERTAQRYTGSRAEVYEVRDINRERYGFKLRGRIAVQDNHWRGNRYDYRRNYRNDGWDEGNFTCRVQNGRIVDLDFSGIRNL